ncbi:MAG: hypothetical protein R3F24_07085 [Gammaproteobacteria bacterium]
MSRVVVVRLCGLVLYLCATLAGAATLAQRINALNPPIVASPFGIPLHLQSVEQDNQVRGEVLAIVPYPLSAIRANLDSPAEWCAVLILHLNVKGCGYASDGDRIRLEMGRKSASTGNSSKGIEFSFSAGNGSATSLLVVLAADSGPLDTRDYRLEFEAAPRDASHSYVRLSYTYQVGAATRFATGTYLQTLGRDKVGFTITGHDSDGEPQYVGGLRGILERNTMRYYLAVDVYLASVGGTGGAQSSTRQTGSLFAAWYDATERYPQQLHEMSRKDYLDAKKAERPFRLSESADNR